MKILYKRLMRRLGRLVQRVGRKIEDRGYFSGKGDTGSYTVGRGVIAEFNMETGEMKTVTPKFILPPDEEKT
jgi:hypothetical protein